MRSKQYERGCIQAWACCCLKSGAAKSAAAAQAQCWLRCGHARPVQNAVTLASVHLCRREGRANHGVFKKRGATGGCSQGVVGTPPTRRALPKPPELGPFERVISQR